MFFKTFEMEYPKREINADPEIIKLVEELCLTGQKSLFEDKPVPMFPYRKLTKEEQQVYRILMPKESNIADFAGGVIPLRVLQVIAHAKSIADFSNIKVWHNENDFLFVSKTTNKEHSWETDYFALAYCSTIELVEFNDLKTEAIRLGREKLRGKFFDQKQEAEANLASLDSWPDSKVLKEA